MPRVANRLKALLSRIPFARSGATRAIAAIKRARPWYRGLLARWLPGRHCRACTRRGEQWESDFEVDLVKPVYFNEKLLWLKYYAYNKSPLVARCYDKHLVRDYVTECGYGHLLNERYGVWDSIDEIPWDRLPDECILKATNGCAGHVFKTADTPWSIPRARQMLSLSASRRATTFRTSGDLFALEHPQRFVCERLMHAPAGRSSLDDYKLYCFHGEPRYLLYIFDRDPQRSRSFKEAFMTADFEDRSRYFQGATDVLPPKPACYEQMLECARELSRAFPFVRVDMYVDEGRPVFGELTFTPAASFVLYHVHDKDGLREMGDWLHLERMSEYGHLFRAAP